MRAGKHDLTTQGQREPRTPGRRPLEPEEDHRDLHDPSAFSGAAKPSLYERLPLFVIPKSLRERTPPAIARHRLFFTIVAVGRFRIGRHLCTHTWQLRSDIRVSSGARDDSPSA
jgi:hypothetical protein